MPGTLPHSARNGYLVTAGAFGILAVTLLANAWLVDDAYITFRTVDNFIHGYGLTWNPAERVQAYTHPLWMFIVALVYALTGEMYFSAILLSFVIAIASVFIARAAVISHGQESGWKSLLLVLCLIASKAFIDYASSGLENPVSYLIAALFLFVFLTQFDARAVKANSVVSLFLLASFAYLNRADTILLYLPALGWVLYAAWSRPKWKLAGLLLVATLPVTLWLAFSIIYYGYPFPNTAYAKAISTAIPLAWKVRRGLEYQVNSLAWDTASYAVIAGAVWLQWRRRSRTELTILGGIALYFLYVLFVGASATHMSGRFYALPIFMAIILFVKGMSNRRAALVVCGLLAAYIVWSPVSAVKFGTLAYQPYPQHQSYIDTKWYVFNEGAALLNFRPGKVMPDHDWYQWGAALRAQPQRVLVGGAYGGEAIGYVGFAAGPEIHFIDVVGLSDPLLARLPTDLPTRYVDWKSGHFHRQIPDGYIESIESGENVIHDPQLREYYEVVRQITRAPVWSLARFSVIVNANLGRYNRLIPQQAQTTSAISE